MKTAYLYIRVSTDEQKRRGYSLPEQEDRLLKYCENNNIEVKGIYREDFSAKTFNRPEWKKLMTVIKSKSSKEDRHILFIKWDRFSRNVEYAYEMLGILRKYRTTAMAIDQPLDFSVPESTVMLAVYLSVPEAENSRRALNTAAGIHRAKLMGRYPNKAPFGYINTITMEGKKIISLKQPEADILGWAFQQLAKNIYKVEDIRKMAEDKGLKCSRSYFYRIIRNPVYCGLIPIKFNTGERDMVKGTHDPLISEALFYEVQQIITTKRVITAKEDLLKRTFFLRGVLECPYCKRRLSGSFSTGSTKRYPYYHCHGKCKTRINALFLNDCYLKELQKLKLSNKAASLFNIILRDWNTNTNKAVYLQNRNLVEGKIKEQESLLSQARKLFVIGVLKLDDFSSLKKEYQTNSKCLKRELTDINIKIESIDQQSQIKYKSHIDVFQVFSNLDTAGKKHLVNLIPPINVDFQTGGLTLELKKALSKILIIKNE